jgi:hypothetical protein
MSKVEPVLKKIYEAPLPEVSDLKHLLSLEGKEETDRIFSFPISASGNAPIAG